MGMRLTAAGAVATRANSKNGINRILPVTPWGLMMAQSLGR